MKFESHFTKKIFELSQKHPGRILFPEGDDPRIQQAARILLDMNVVRELTLLVSNHSVLIPVQDTRIKIRSSQDLELKCLTGNAYESFLKLKNKSVDFNDLKKISENPLYQAGALLNLNSADCVVAGCVATTADVIRAAIATVGLAEGCKTVSGSFIMDRSFDQAGGTYVFADCGVVIDPTANQLADIAQASCQTYRKIVGGEPVVAFLSFSTSGSASHPFAQKMRQANDLFQLQAPGIDSDGDIQFDAAYVGEIGNRKAPKSKIPGRTNCFVFPNLDAGNIAYKITQRLAGFGAYGPILQGLAKPYSDLSRGASAEEIALVALINRLRAL